MVELANKIDGWSMGLTLFVPGAVISGVLIGIKEYYARYGLQWRQVLGDNDAGNALEAKWRKFGEDAFATIAAEEEKTDVAPVLPSYIHLRDARIILGSAVVPVNEGLLWRGRIGAVAGFSVGLMSANK